MSSAVRPDAFEIRALQFLYASGGLNGGHTAGQISRGAGLGSTRSTMALMRSMVLMPMIKKGWLAPLDHQKPVIFCLTPAGRAALAQETSHAD